MLYFLSDYTEGAHPKLLERLQETNLISQPGYGEDRFCAAAREKIRATCGKPGADVYFLVGGTQANAVTIASLLQRWEGVIAADTGHIGVHEAGMPRAGCYRQNNHDGNIAAQRSMMSLAMMIPS